MILEPWPHIVMDDFLSPEDLLSLQLKCVQWKEEIILPKIERTGITEGHNRLNCDPGILKDYNISEYFNQFTRRRPYKELNERLTLIRMNEGSTFPIHCDAPHKIFALIIYIAPEFNLGTVIYDTDGKHGEPIEWKPNRAVMCCPLTDVTWHSYDSQDDRYTLLYNLVNKRET